jgi:hypothetical protein
VLSEAALLDELLRHDIAGGEEYLCEVTDQSLFNNLLVPFIAVAVYVYHGIVAVDKGIR